MSDHAFTPGRTSLPTPGDDLAGPGGLAPGKRALTDGVSPVARDPVLFTGARWEAIDPDEAGREGEAEGEGESEGEGADKGGLGDHADHAGDMLAFAGGAPTMSAAPAAPAPIVAAPAPAPADAKTPARKAKVQPVTKTKSFKEYVVKPASPRTYDPLAGKQTLGGTDLAAVNTQPAEAKVLNALRANDKRFNAAALIVAQQNLGVTNATGAFNTETLRQLKAKTNDARLSDKDPQVAVAAIIEESLWKPYHTAPGVELFFAPVDGVGGKKADRTATRQADRVAQAMGYESYKTYKGQLKKFSFLGVEPPEGKNLAHPHLIARLAAAEAFLKQRHGEKVTPEKIGWQGGLVGTYHTDEAQIAKGTAHFHTMGLAVDFDPSINGYLYPQSDLKSQTMANMTAKNEEIEKRNKDKKPDEALEDLFDAHGIATEWVKQTTNFMDVAFTQAGYLFNAVVLTKAKMMEWSNTLSTEELHARIASAAAALKQYIDLAKAKGNDKVIIDKFVAAGFTAAQAREALPEMRKFPERYSGGFSRHQTKGLPTTHSLDLLVALRDVAGLTFGGSEMSHGDNGDFMHFDCRNDPLGQRARGEMG